jgi:hypothetical protein
MLTAEQVGMELVEASCEDDVNNERKKHEDGKYR